MTSSEADGSVPLAALPEWLRGGSVAIGNFDGVHRGHQSVLSAALAAGRPALALTFEPHPRAFFSGRPIFRLTPGAQKAAIIRALGLDASVVAPFDAAFASQPADRFIKDALAGVLRARHVVVGGDFSFGAGRSGSVETLRAAGPHHGFEVEVVDGVADEADEGAGVISSTRIRRHFADGEVEAAAALLGYRPFVVAPVVHGEKRGRTMGYPTANQRLSPQYGLRHGIYAVRVRIEGRWWDGVASFGRRPTFDNGAPLLETFVFDFSGDLYGRDLMVTFGAFLRPEQKFSSMDALVEQMDADSRDARAVLSRLAPLSPLDAALNFAAPSPQPMSFAANA